MAALTFGQSFRAVRIRAPCSRPALSWTPCFRRTPGLDSTTEAAIGWVREEMRRFAQPWFVAGGWALDLFAAGQSRQHSDVDIAIFRGDQSHLQRALPNWEFAQSRLGKLSAWSENEHLALPIHEIHAQHGTLRLEFLLNERSESMWHFRRALEVTLPLTRLSGISAGGIPFLAPEVVLLYKAKGTRPVDSEDFRRILPRLAHRSRSSLAAAIAHCHPGHCWLGQLQE
jgi:hypothetical protein